MKEVLRLAVFLSLIVAVSIVVAASLVLLSVSGSRGSSSGCPSGITTDQPMDSDLSFSTSVDSVRGLNHWYNFTVESSSSTANLGSLSFEVKAPTGVVTTMGGTGRVAIVSPSNLTEATYSLGGGWTYATGFGPTTIVSAQNVLSLSYVGAQPPTIVGDDFFVLYCGGSVSGPIT